MKRSYAIKASELTDIIADRFWAKVKRTDGCWEWTGEIQYQGRGRFYIGKRRCFAYRVSWALANGDLPEGMLVCHHCDNPLCVRPDHLFLGTDSDNLKDCYRKGRSNLPRVRPKFPKATSPYCPHGHLFDEANTARKLNGSRQCRKCKNAYNARRARERKEMIIENPKTTSG